MDVVKNLPNELQNKVFYYSFQHPCATMMQDEMDRRFEHVFQMYDWEVRYIRRGKFTKREIYDINRRNFSMHYFMNRNGETWLQYA